MVVEAEVRAAARLHLRLEVAGVVAEGQTKTWGVAGVVAEDQTKA